MADPLNLHGSNITIKWKAEPATRGTFTLLSSCIITLTLCVWSAVHLNLPGNAQGKWPKFLRRLAWITCGLVAPEYLILTSWSQRETAKRIFREVEDTFNSKRRKATDDLESQPSTRRHPWTMTHSFWAIMGGIAMDPGGPDPFIPLSQRTTLTANGILLLLKHEPQLLPDISEEEVKDRRKGSSLTKTFACIQATWFCLSCIARICQSLPVSLLELSTFAHAICTVIVYILWWKKPLDIEQPLVIKDERMRPLLAYMWMASKTSNIPKPRSSDNTTITVGRDPEFEAILIRDKSTISQGTATTPTASATYRAPSYHRKTTPDPTTIAVTPTQSLPDTNFYANPNSTRWKYSITYSSGNDEFAKSETTRYQDPQIFNLTPDGVRRWKLAKAAMDKHRLSKPVTNLDLVTVKSPAEFMELTRAEANKDSWAILSFCVLAACYGGLHGLAWNSRFPSHREMILWRVSALIMAVPAGVSSLVVLLVCIAPYAVLFLRSVVQPCRSNRNSNQAARRRAPNEPSSQPSTAASPSKWKKALRSLYATLRVVGYALGVNVMLFLYFPARAYLVYESFRTVFYLPPDAYKATWSQYLPHIT